MEISDISEVIEDNNEDEHQELGDQDGSQKQNDPKKSKKQKIRISSIITWRSQ